MHRIFSLFLSSALILSLCACSSTTAVNNKTFNISDSDSVPDVKMVLLEENSESSSEISSIEKDESIGSDNGNTTMGNPWSNCKTIEEAESIVGFTFDSIKSIETKDISIMLAEGMNIIQVHFYDNDNEITIRKSNAVGDVSGDHRTFEKIIKETKENAKMIYNGNGETFGLVTWVKDDFSYSISFENEVSKETLDYYVGLIFNDETIINKEVLHKRIVADDNFQSGDVIAQFSIPVMIRIEKNVVS